MKIDKEFWDQRWENEETGWDIGSASPPIVSFINKLKDKSISILIPGCGNAYEAEYLWDNGFEDVHVLDISEEPLKMFAEVNPDFPVENLHCENFFEHKGKYDLIIEQTFFCALDPSLRPEYVEKMHDLLKDDGILAGLLFNDPLNTDHPPFGGNTMEYLGYFQPHFSKIEMKPAKNSIPPRKGRELFIKIQK